MKIEQSTVTKLILTELNGLDPISVYLEDFALGKGKITISCWNETWASYWGGMGKRNISEFFCSCDKYYLTNNLAPNLDIEIPDIDKIREDAEENNIEVMRDDPWNDYDFMSQLYSRHIEEWGDSLPKKQNPRISYLHRIIEAVKIGLKQAGCVDER